jgi:hypothetical protein
MARYQGRREKRHPMQTKKQNKETAQAEVETGPQG